VTEPQKPSAGTVGWSVDLWDGDGHGLRIYCDSATGTLDFALLYTKEEAHQADLLEDCSAAVGGYPPGAVDLTKLDSDDTVMLWGGMPSREQTADFCRRVLAMLDADRKTGEI